MMVTEEGFRGGAVFPDSLAFLQQPLCSQATDGVLLAKCRQQLQKTINQTKPDIQLGIAHSPFAQSLINQNHTSALILANVDANVQNSDVIHNVADSLDAMLTSVAALPEAKSVEITAVLVTPFDWKKPLLFDVSQ